MGIKGCRKNLVVMKNIGSDFIEEAYFVLKNELEVQESIERTVR